MADDDLPDRARALQQRAEAVRADAVALRAELREELNPAATELGLTVDRAVRAKMTADHAVEDAEARVESLEASTAEMRTNVANAEATVTAATAKGDTYEANEARERNVIGSDLIEQGEARIHAAKLEAADLRDAASIADRLANEARLAYSEKTRTGLAAEAEIDKIEDQADLLEQALTRLTEAGAVSGGDIAQRVIARAVLEDQAASLLTKADAITVDRSVIAVILPSADDPVTPPPTSADLMDPNDDDSSMSFQADGDDGDALGLDLASTTTVDPSPPDEETESIEDVAVPDGTEQVEISAFDQTQQFGWGTEGDDTLDDDWNHTADHDAAGSSAVDDESFDDGSLDDGSLDDGF